MGTAPEQNTKPPATIAWEYMPGMAIGAFLVKTAVLVDILANLGVLVKEATATGVGWKLELYPESLFWKKE
jgi:hypothetical protein